MAPGVSDGHVTVDVTWPESSRSWHQYAWSRLSRQLLEIQYMLNYDFTWP